MTLLRKYNSKFLFSSEDASMSKSYYMQYSKQDLKILTLSDKKKYYFFS